MGEKEELEKLDVENFLFAKVIEQQKEKQLKTNNPKQPITEIIIDSKPISSGCSQLNTLKLMNY